MERNIPPPQLLTRGEAADYAKDMFIAADMKLVGGLNLNDVEDALQSMGAAANAVETLKYFGFFARNGLVCIDEFSAAYCWLWETLLRFRGTSAERTGS